MRWFQLVKPVGILNARTSIIKQLSTIGPYRSLGRTHTVHSNHEINQHAFFFCFFTTWFFLLFNYLWLGDSRKLPRGAIKSRVDIFFRNCRHNATTQRTSLFGAYRYFDSVCVMTFIMKCRIVDIKDIVIKLFKVSQHHNLSLSATE